ncbi:MAG: hypothetical protein WCO94_07370 [Verrucomicrobiota bacterium]
MRKQKNKRASHQPGKDSPLTRFLKRPLAPWLFAMALLVFLMFADVLLTSNPTILSNPDTDISAVDVPIKSFGFERLHHGEIAGWNPFIWSGTAYFAGFDTGLLFPLNALFLVLPFSKAMNLVMALETWVLGIGVFFLCRQREISALASFLCGSVMMFAPIYFLHIYAGHPNNVSAMAMAPYIYLAAGMIGAGRSRQGWLLGSAALALQLLSCQAQYVYYTCLGILFYSLLCLGSVKAKWRYLVTLGIMAGAAVAMAAVQLLPARAYIAESLRSSKGMPYDFAAMFSLPPENLLTLVSPVFFGNMDSVAYWGRCYFWEMTLFVGITTLFLTIYGFGAGPSWVRRVALPMVLLTFVLALGAHTPLFRILYDHAPGFNSLRGNSKFFFHTALFAILVAGAGFDAAIRTPKRLRKAADMLAGSAVILGLAGIWIIFQAADHSGGLWAVIPRTIWLTQESYLPSNLLASPTFVWVIGLFAARGLFIAVGTLCILAILIVRVGRRPRLLFHAITFLAIFEVFIFARGMRPAFNLHDSFAQTGDDAIMAFLADHPGDYRILLTDDPNSAMILGAQNIWGYGSTPLKRYIEFMGFTQCVDPDTADQYVPICSAHRLYGMLRCKYIFLPGENGPKIIDLPSPMPRISLISEAKVIAERDQIFATMKPDSFDPSHTVILESQPEPAPVKSSNPGTATITASGLDYLEIEAKLDSSAILLVTDIFTKGWEVVPMADSSQSHYDVMPANYILRGVPLAAGSHHLRMQYHIPGFVLGAVISGVAWVIWIAIAILLLKFRHHQMDPEHFGKIGASV